MEVVNKEGVTIGPAPVCQAKGCAHKSSARIVDLTVPKKRWKDLCRSHAKVVCRVYKGKVEPDAAWNELRMEDFNEV